MSSIQWHILTPLPLRNFVNIINRGYIKKFLINGVKLCVSGVLIFFLIKSLKWNTITSVLAHANWRIILSLIPLSLCGQIFCAVKWCYITKAFLPKTNITTYVELYFVGSFINRFLPSTIGGDIGRAGLLSRIEDLSFSQSSVTVLIERVTGFTILIFTGCIGAMKYLSDTSNSVIIPGIICCLMGIIFILMFFFTSKFNNAGNLSLFKYYTNIYHQLSPYRGNFKILTVSLLLSVLFYFVELVIHWSLFSQFNFSIQFGNLAAIIPVIYLVGSLPITISGLGVRENSYIYFFGFAGLPPEISLTVSFIIFFYAIVQSLVGGLLLMKILLSNNKKIEMRIFGSLNPLL